VLAGEQPTEQLAYRVCHTWQLYTLRCYVVNSKLRRMHNYFHGLLVLLFNPDAMLAANRLAVQDIPTHRQSWVRHLIAMRYIVLIGGSPFAYRADHMPDQMCIET
jgi:hypothetical protein